MGVWARGTTRAFKPFAKVRSKTGRSPTQAGDGRAVNRRAMACPFRFVRRPRRVPGAEALEGQGEARTPLSMLSWDANERLARTVRSRKRPRFLAPDAYGASAEGLQVPCARFVPPRGDE